MKRIALSVMVVVMVLCCGAMMSSASTWNATLDFSESNNPSNGWEYGSVSGGVFTRFSGGGDWYSAYHSGTLWAWGSLPGVGHSPSGVDVTLWGGRGVLYSTDLLLVPGYGSRASVGWQATANGVYKVDAVFSSCDINPDNPTVYVREPSLTTSSTINSTQGFEYHSYTYLTSGQMVYFDMGSGPDNDPSYNGAGLAASIETTTNLGIVDGTVKNSSSTPWPGTPIAGATVEVVGGSESTTTDANGYYRLWLAPGAYTLRATKQDYVVTDGGVTAVDQQGVVRNFDLDQSLVGIRGVVTASSTSRWPGKPIAGAAVEAGAQSVVTGADGEYTLQVPSGTYDVTVTRHGFQTVTETDVEVGGGLVTRDYGLDVVGGAYVWDAGMDFSQESNPNSQWQYGRRDITFETFSLLGAGGAWNEVWAWSKGTNGFPAVGHSPTDQMTTLWGRCKIGPSQLMMQPSSSEGSAVVRWEAPIDGTYTISATFEGIDPGSIGTTSGAWVHSDDGSLDWFTWIDGFGTVESVSQSMALTKGQAVYFEVNDGQNYESSYDTTGLVATIALDSNTAGIVKGVVTASSETPWPGKVLSDATVTVGSVSTVTAADGSYEMWVPSGTYAMTVSCSSFETDVLPELVVPANGVAVRDVQLNLQSGTYLWDIAADFSEQNNPNGQWSYGYVDPGTGAMTLFVEKGNFLPQFGNVDCWGWFNSGEYTGIVHSHSGATAYFWGRGPINPDQVGIGSPGNFNGVTATRFTAPVDGEYTLNALVKCIDYGQMGVRVFCIDTSKLDWSTTFVSEFGVTRDPIVQTLALNAGESIYFGVDRGPDGTNAYDGVAFKAGITLQFTGGMIAGRVIDASSTPGVPLQGAAVEIVGGGISVITGTGGRFGIEAPAGEATLRVSKAGYDPTDVPVTIVDGKYVVIPDIELRLSGVAVTGKVNAELWSRLPIIGATVQAGLESATTDVFGNYSLFVSPGTHTVTVSKSGYVTEEASGVVVGFDGLTGLNFELAPDWQPGTFVWDIARDFNEQMNPNGQWSYGYVDVSTGAMTMFVENGHFMPQFGNVDCWGWFDSGAYTGIVHSHSGETVNWWGRAPVDPDQVGIGSPGSFNGVTAARFVAPVDGDYTLNALVKCVDYGQMGVRVFCSDTSKLDWSTTFVSEFGVTRDPIVRTLALSAGESINFGVDRGPDNSNAYDAVAFKASITLQSDAGVVKGRVTDGTGSAVANAVVKTSDDAYSTITGIEGYYERMMPAGNYTFTACSPRYGSQSSGIALGAGDIVTCNFTLSGSRVIWDTGAPHHVTWNGNPTILGMPTGYVGSEMPNRMVVVPIKVLNDSRITDIEAWYTLGNEGTWVDSMRFI